MNVYIMMIHIAIVGIIYCVFEIIGYYYHLKRIKNIIINNDLLECNEATIRKFIIEKYGFVPTAKDINKATKKIN